MASRISFEEHGFGDAPCWGESAVVSGAADRHADGDPPTVRSARCQPHEREDDGGVPTDGLAAAPRSVREPVAPSFATGAPESELSVDVEFEDDEPCPATLRSPVASGISPSVRRARVA